MIKQQDTATDTYGPVVVRAGDHVQLAGGTGSVRLSLEAVALEPGRQGARIHLRLLRGGARLSGMVTGPAQVRLAPNVERKP